MAALFALALLAGADPDPAPVPVLAHDVTRGEALRIEDFVREARPEAAGRGALTPEQAAGMEAVRNLSAGAIVRRTDVARPQLVRRGEPVTIRIVNGGLTITASGRALAGGAAGEVVRVVTLSTNRTLDAVVDGSSSVRLVTP